MSKQLRGAVMWTVVFRAANSCLQSGSVSGDSSNARAKPRRVRGNRGPQQPLVSPRGYISSVLQQDRSPTTWLLYR